MTKQDVINYINAQLVVPVNVVSKVISSLLKILDFITESVIIDIVPDWTAGQTFNTDGSGDGKYCKHPDVNGVKRIFETKTDGNIGNAPPTDPLITENANWKEISPSVGSAIKEWTAGTFGSGLMIVYHNHSVHGSCLVKLVDPVRPFTSTNIETEITAGKWEILNDISRIDRAVVVTAGAVLTLDMAGKPVRSFKGDAIISGPKTWAFTGVTRAVSIPAFFFELDDVHDQTLPANVLMSDVRKVGAVWTPEVAGKYKAKLDYDGADWWLDISPDIYE
jgi:hypothetical protein